METGSKGKESAHAQYRLAKDIGVPPRRINEGVCPRSSTGHPAILALSASLSYQTICGRAADRARRSLRLDILPQYDNIAL